MARIELDDVSLTFRVRRCARHLTWKEYLLREVFRRGNGAYMDVAALQEVSFRVGEGERLAVLGHNGAGKSTLLKLLAGVYQPTSGHRLVQGRVCSLFDLALGFEPDASGWENIQYRGYLQGETTRSIRAKTPAIAEFTELGDFLNMPIRYYSAGMVVRLAFSIATATEPEILLVDEVLSVGDLAFQRKARERIREMMSRAHLMVMVSHDLDSLSEMCDRAVWMDHGRVRAVGTAAELVQAYRQSVRAAAQAA